jgi:hypothetical protein
MLRAPDRWWLEFRACAPLSNNETEVSRDSWKQDRSRVQLRGPCRAVLEEAALNFIDELVVTLEDETVT